MVGEMAQELRACIAAATDYKSCWNTIISQLTTASNSSNRESISSYGFWRHCTHVYKTQTHNIYITKIKS